MLLFFVQTQHRLFVVAKVHPRWCVPTFTTAITIIILGTQATVSIFLYIITSHGSEVDTDRGGKTLVLNGNMYSLKHTQTNGHSLRELCEQNMQCGNQHYKTDLPTKVAGEHK